MNIDLLREAEIQRDFHNIEVPRIEFIHDSNKLYVQMNIQSLATNSSGKLIMHRGFLFAVDIHKVLHCELKMEDGFPNLASLFQLEIRPSILPKIYLAQSFPTLFHPHFKVGYQTGVMGKLTGKWIDYKDEESDDLEQDLGSYIIRVARSLQYEKGYIDHRAKKIGNHKALRFYHKKRKEPGQIFPTDNVDLPVKIFEINARNNCLETTEIQAAYSRPKPKFEVSEITPSYTPIEKEIVRFQNQPNVASDFRQQSEPDHQFFLRDSAFNTIKNHIKWSERTPENIVEQGGILLGDSYYDPNHQKTYAVAERAIPGQLARGSSGYLEITHETWKAMLDSVDQLETDLKIIGWYHTHPNGLDVFMSGTDRETQNRFFGKDWQFAIVLNPQKCIWRSFFGSNSQECKGYILTE